MLIDDQDFDLGINLAAQAELKVLRKKISIRGSNVIGFNHL